MKDPNFWAADKDATFDNIYKEICFGIKIIDGNIWSGIEAWRIFEDDTIVHYALLNIILDGSDKVDDGDTTEVNRIDSVTAYRMIYCMALSTNLIPLTLYQETASIVHKHGEYIRTGKIYRTQTRDV